MWQALDYHAEFRCDLPDAPWPAVDETVLVSGEVQLVLQINGKTRGSLIVPRDASRALVEQAAAAHEMVKRFCAGREVSRMIIVPNRLVNMVTG